MQDLSHLAAGSLAVSSMTGGNSTSSNEKALGGPGSPPARRVPTADDEGTPAVVLAAKPVSVYEQGGGGYAPAPAVWKETPDG